MSSEKNKAFPALARPPLVEVVCGVVFDSFPDLDALVLGIYWNSRKDQYPKHSLQAALADELSIDIGVFPVRAFLVSQDGQFIIQLQHDRFFMNWRASGSEYPRFSERHGKRGLLVRAMEEYELFCAFIESQFGNRPIARRIELTKIDILRRGEHWRDLDALAKLMPVTSVFSTIQQSDNRDVNLRFIERAHGGALLVHVATLMEGNTPASVRVEARCVAKPEPEISAAFYSANTIINDAFFRLIPDAREHFGTKGEGL